MGTEGVVIEKKEAKARMVIEVTILGQGTVVEIDSDLLEPMEWKLSTEGWKLIPRICWRLKD